MAWHTFLFQSLCRGDVYKRQSLGLNVNSTAVIIGAMLISPLMGPIMGVGLAIGQNDFELLKRSLKS